MHPGDGERLWGPVLCFCCLCSTSCILPCHSNSKHRLHGPSDPKQIARDRVPARDESPSPSQRPVCELVQNTHGPIHRPAGRRVSASFPVPWAEVAKAPMQVFRRQVEQLRPRMLSARAVTETLPAVCALWPNSLQMKTPTLLFSFKLN